MNLTQLEVNVLMICIAFLAFTAGYLCGRDDGPDGMA